MNRDTAIRAYQRVKEWERRASTRLLAELRQAGACDPIPLTLHNWGQCGGEEPYKTLDRRYRYEQERIWRTAERLANAFARYF